MIRFFIRRPALAALVLVLVVVTGLLSLKTLTLELWPPVEINQVRVTTAYPGASPEEVEDLITIPIEDELDGLEDVDYIASSSTEGMSQIEVAFKATVGEAEMDDKARDVQQRVNRAADLPSDATTPRVDKIATENMPVVILAVSGPFAELEIKRLADDLEDEIDNIPGVKKVWKTGVREREIAIELDPSRLEAYGLTPLDVLAAVSARNVDVPAGSLFVGGTETLLRVLGKPEQLDGLDRIVLRDSPLGTVHLGDVATVRDTFKDASVLSHLNGRRCVLLMIAKERHASTTTLVKQADQVAELFAARHPGVMLETVLDTSKLVVRRMRELAINGAEGFCLVLLILWFTVGWRRAVFTALGIPVSFLATFVVMRFTGISLNFMTLYAVFIVLGILVDDAIVVIENITRLMEEGESPKRAALLGAQQVAMPVVIAVTTTIAAFATMLLMKGMLGRFMSFLPRVVIIVLVCSLAEALLLLPTHVAEFVPAQASGAHLETRAGRLMRRLQDLLERVLTHLLKRPLRSFAIPPLLLALILSLAWVVIKVEMFPPEEPEELYITFQLPPGSSIETTETMAYAVERAVMAMAIPDVEAVYVAIGYSMGEDLGAATGKNIGQVICVLKDRQDRQVSGFQTAERLRRELSGRFAGLDWLRVSVPQSGPPTGKPVYVRVMGEDFAVLEAIAEEIKALVATQAGVINIDDDRREGNPEARIRIDEAKVAQTGVDFTQVALTIRSLFIGSKAGERRVDGENVDITIQGPFELRRLEDALTDTTITSATGEPVPLSSLVNVTLARGPAAVLRRDDTHVVSVTADIRQASSGRKANANKINSLIAERFQDSVPARYPGYHVEFGGEAEKQAESFGSLRIAFIAAILIIYALLVLQFNTLAHPLVVMMAIPLTIVGVVLGMILFREAFTLSHMIGVVALAGIAVNDSLVYIDYINVLRRQEGLPRDVALIEAAKTRLRPILLTSLTTIGGLLPMALRIGGGSAYLSPLASTIIYGLTTQTVFTLLFIPVGYHVVDDIAGFFRRTLWLRIVPEEDPRDADL